MCTYSGSHTDETFEPVEKLILLYFYPFNNMRALEAEDELHDILMVRDDPLSANIRHANEHPSFAGKNHSDKSKAQMSKSLSYIRPKF